MKKPKKVNRKKLRKQLEVSCMQLWSDIIHKRDKVCVICGKSEREGKLDAHHVWSRGGHKSVRYDLDNGCLLCFYCHRVKVHQQGAQELGLWLVDKHGKEWFQNLKTRAKTSGKLDMEKIKEELLVVLQSYETK